jgi:hypothetical protein
VPSAVNAKVSAALKNKPQFVSPVFVIDGELADPSGNDTGLVNAAPLVSSLVAIAVAILSNSVLISVPLTILLESPELRLSFAAKLTVFE